MDRGMELQTEAFGKCCFKAFSAMKLERNSCTLYVVFNTDKD